MTPGFDVLRFDIWFIHDLMPPWQWIECMPNLKIKKPTKYKYVWPSLFTTYITE